MKVEYTRRINSRVFSLLRSFLRKVCTSFLPIPLNFASKYKMQHMFCLNMTELFQIKAAYIKRFVVLNIIVTKIEKFRDKFQCCWKQKYCYIKFKFSNLRSRLLTCYLCQGLCATFFYFNLDFDVATWQIKWLGLHWMDTGRPRFTWTKS